VIRTLRSPGDKQNQRKSAHPNFDRIARLYRWAEYLLLGPLLQRTRLQLLPELHHTRQALVLGDGDGRFLSELLRSAPHCRVLAIDLSPAMLRLLELRCSFARDRVRTLQCSVDDLSPQAIPSGTDVIATHFFLDCLTQAQVSELGHTLARATLPGSLWVISEFGVPAAEPWRSLARAYVQSLYVAFRLLTGLQVQRLPDISQALEAAGWRRLKRVPRLHGFLYSELWTHGSCS